MITDPLALIRTAHFAATLLASGTVFFAALVIGPIRSSRNFPKLREQMNVLVWIGLALSILTGAMWLIWLAANIFGESLTDVCLHGGAWSVLADTRFGWICCLRLALAVFLGLLVLTPTHRVWPVAAAAAFLALPAFASHAGATPGPRGNVHVVSDALHLLSAGAWLGALPAFVLLLWSAHRSRKPGWHDFTIKVTRRFSWLAALSVGALLATGIVNSWNLLGGVRDLWTTDYGRLIGFKIVLLASMIAIAKASGPFVLRRASGVGWPAKRLLICCVMSARTPGETLSHHSWISSVVPTVTLPLSPTRSKESSMARSITRCREAALPCVASRPLQFKTTGKRRVLPTNAALKLRISESLTASQALPVLSVRSTPSVPSRCVLPAPYSA